jgi:hypothetical protein
MMKLGPENTSNDVSAKYLYNLHRNLWGKPRHLWKPFEGLTRKERDYWRMQTELAEGFNFKEVINGI